VGARQPHHELATTDAELAKTEAAVERYMLAFENGSVAEQMFGDRVRELGRKTQALRARRAELAADVAADEGPGPAPENLEELRVQLIDVAEHGPEPVRKPVAPAFIHSLVVEAGNRVQPTFRIPSGRMETDGNGNGANGGGSRHDT